MFSIWWGLRISYTMINYVMHICVDKSLEFSYHMFNCNCCEIWWMFFLWTLFVQLNIMANLLFACRFKMGYICLIVQSNIVANFLFHADSKCDIFYLFNWIFWRICFLHADSKWDIFVLTWQLLCTRFN